MREVNPSEADGEKKVYMFSYGQAAINKCNFAKSRWPSSLLQQEFFQLLFLEFFFFLMCNCGRGRGFVSKMCDIESGVPMKDHSHLLVNISFFHFSPFPSPPQ